MSDNFKMFVETLKAPNTKKVVNSLQAIGKYDYSKCTSDDLELIILSMRPNSPKAIITICYVLGLYAKYLNDNNLYDMIQEIDKSSLWLKAKSYAPKKFISYSQFEDVYNDIGVYEETNGFYYQSLFRCLYEGIYNDDMSVIKNLRSSDIRGNVVTLHEDGGNSYDMEISEELAIHLKELGGMNTWERKNRYGIYMMKVSGLHHDSCFKTEIRKDYSEYAFRFTYYRILRKIAKEYVEHNLLPLQIFVSGIMYRINNALKEHDISLKEAFADHNRDRVVGKIISDELARCNYDIDVRNFRQIVKGHLDIFSE